jgi:hypothetical protein
MLTIRNWRPVFAHMQIPKPASGTQVQGDTFALFTAIQE